MRPSGETSRSTANMRWTLPAKKMPDRSTPASLPSERSCVVTTTATVVSMTTEDVGGWRRRLGIEFHEKVPIETMIITATSAGIGTRPTHGPSTASRNSRNAPATKVDRRRRPPEVTLITAIDHRRAIAVGSHSPADRH